MTDIFPLLTSDLGTVVPPLDGDGFVPDQHVRSKGLGLVAEYAETGVDRGSLLVPLSDSSHHRIVVEHLSTTSFSGFFGLGLRLYAVADPDDEAPQDVRRIARTDFLGEDGNGDPVTSTTTAGSFGSELSIISSVASDSSVIIDLFQAMSALTTRIIAQGVGHRGTGTQMVNVSGWQTTPAFTRSVLIAPSFTANITDYSVKVYALS